MLKTKTVIISAVLILISQLLFTSCGKKYTPEQEKYISKVKISRETKNLEFMNDPNSPFNQDPKANFHALNYYDVDPGWVFQSKLTEYTKQDTITVYGTKGETRKAVRFGYLTFNKNNKNYKLNVYKNLAENGAVYYSIWFTDKTTNNETYGVGRYLEFDLNSDPNHEYTIDFNLAFNPYCAYSANYTCAVPTREDFINLAIEAGEKKFHE